MAPNLALTTGLRKGVLLALRGYKLFISPLLGQHCRFYPSCSNYAMLAVDKHGVLHGGWLATKRICRCHPLNPGGVDYPPGCAPEK
jgi:uncharacterized protein